MHGFWPILGIFGTFEPFFIFLRAFTPQKLFTNQGLYVYKTRPLLDSEAATMYELKAQSSNMQTGQSFKNKELVCLAGPIPLLSQANWLRLIRLG